MTLTDIVVQDGRVLLVMKVYVPQNVKTTEFARVQITVNVAMGILEVSVKYPFAEKIAETGEHVSHQTNASVVQTLRETAVKYPSVAQHVKTEEPVSDLVYANAHLCILEVTVRNLSVLQNVKREVVAVQTGVPVKRGGAATDVTHLCVKEAVKMVAYAYFLIVVNVQKGI